MTTSNFFKLFFIGGGDLRFHLQNTTVVNSATENCEKATADPNLVLE